MVCEIGWINLQCGNGLSTTDDDFTSLFQEDIQQFSAVIIIFRCRRSSYHHRLCFLSVANGFRQRLARQCGQSSHVIFDALCRRHRSLGQYRTLAAHQRLELTKLFVIDEQSFCERALIAEHVNEKTHRPQAIP